jgi:hypothetical protein
MVDNLHITAKQKQIAKLKSQGLKQKDIAKIVYPEATEHSGAVLISRELKKGHVAKYVEQGRDIAIKKYAITWDKLISKLNAMLEAEKFNQFTGEIVPDYTTQLSAVKVFMNMLPVDDDKTSPHIYDNNDLQKALSSNVDEVELQRLTFRKKSTS